MLFVGVFVIDFGFVVCVYFVWVVDFVFFVVVVVCVVDVDDGCVIGGDECGFGIVGL